ncbi:unnamed protein product, partial [Ixodes hexagonus]
SLQYSFTISYRKEGARQYELKAETEAECNNWVQAIDIASFSKMLLQKEELEQKHLHLVQIVESEKTAKWQYTQQCEELTVEIKKLRAELCALKKEWRLTPHRSEDEDSEEIKKIKKVQSFFRGWLCRRRWKQIVAEYISSPHAENMRKRNRQNPLVFRMVEAEEEYVEQLQLLVSCFLRPFKMAASSQKPPCTHDEVNSIFLNSETLMFLHQIFLKGLTARMESWPTLVLGDLFDMLLPMLTIYQEYVRNHHYSLQVLAECKQRDKFAAILQRLEEKTLLQGRTLETFLTYPMHQVPRYIITLHELLAHTPHNHVERRSLETARTKLEELSRQMHDEVSETENIRKNLAIERMIIGGCDILLDVNQVFVRQGNVIHVVGSEKAKSQRSRIPNLKGDKEVVRQCYLFTNHMLLCNRTSAGKLHLVEGVGKIPLADATLIEDPNDQFQFIVDDGEGSVSSVSSQSSGLGSSGDSNALAVAPSGGGSGQQKDYGGLDFKIIVDFKTAPPVTVQLVAPTMQEKAAWTSDISQCIDNVHFNDLFHGTMSDSSSVTMPHSIRNDPRLFKDDVDIRFSRTLNSCKLPQIRYASPERLFERLTDLRFLSIDFLNTFLLTYRVFTDGVKVLEALKKVHYNPDLQINAMGAALQDSTGTHGSGIGEGERESVVRKICILAEKYFAGRALTAQTIRTKIGKENNHAKRKLFHKIRLRHQQILGYFVSPQHELTAEALLAINDSNVYKNHSPDVLNHSPARACSWPGKANKARALRTDAADGTGREPASVPNEYVRRGAEGHKSKYMGSREADEKKKVKKRVKETEREIWEAGMQTKSVLEIYRSFKKDIAKEPTFDNSRGSSLLFEARTGVSAAVSSNGAGVSDSAPKPSRSSDTLTAEAASGPSTPSNMSSTASTSTLVGSVGTRPAARALPPPMTSSQSAPNVMNYLRVRGAQGKRGSSDTESSSVSVTPRSSFQTESTILSTPRSSFQYPDSPQHSSKAGVVVTSSRASARRSSTASAAAAFAAATAGSSNPPEPLVAAAAAAAIATAPGSQPQSRAGSRLPSAVGADLKIPGVPPGGPGPAGLRSKRESMISTAATMRVLNVLRHWVSKHSQVYRMRGRLHAFTDQYRGSVRASGQPMPQSVGSTSNIFLGPENTSKSDGSCVSYHPHFRSASLAPVSRLVSSAHHYASYALQIFLKVTDFLGQAWMKPEKATKAPHILLMTRRFNDVSRLVVSEIMRCPEMSKRVVIIDKWSAVADICRCLHNFNGVLQICAAFMNSSVFRLKKTWEKVSKTTKQTIDKLQALVSADGRFRNMRDALHRCDPPCIPYLGMYLTDLSFIEEGTPNFTEEGLLNFSKMRMIAHVIREIRHFQQTPYKIEMIPKVFNYLLDPGRLMPDEELYRLSLCLEPRLSRLGTKVTASPFVPSYASTTTS